MTPRDHARAFILPIDPRHGIRSIARTLWHAAATDEAIAGKFAEIQKRMGSGEPLLTAEQYDLYERLKDGAPALDIPTAPDWIRPAFAAAYLHARAAVAAGKVRAPFDDIEGRLDAVLKLIDRLESGFIGELLAETMLAAREDRRFAHKLVEGAAEFRGLVNELYGPDGTERPEALARAAGGGGGGGDCTCCTNTPDGRNCQPCSCWIIVVIIVIIIVAK